MIRYRRLFCAPLAAVAVISLATGCGGSSHSAGSTHITLWSMWTKGEAGQQVMQTAIDDFKKQTGITVDVQWKGRAPVKQMLPALNSNKAPVDIVESNNTEIVNSLAQTGNALDLTSLYASKPAGESQTVGELVGDGYKAYSSTTNGTPVMVPYNASSYAMYYNAKNFPDLATNPPTSWDALYPLLNEEKGKGVAPLALDGSIASYNAYYMNYFVTGGMGADAWSKALTDKTGQLWLQPGYLAAAQQVERLVKGGYFIKGYDASKFPAMEDKWANNDAAFIMMGTWLPAEVAPAAAPGLEYQAFPFPGVDGKPVPPLQVAVSGLAVLKKSTHTEAAEKFASFLLQPKYQNLVTTSMKNIPIRTDVAGPSELTAVKKQLDAGNFNKNVLTAAATTYLLKIFYPLDDQLLFGKFTAQQFVTKLAQQSAAYWKSQS